MRKMVLAMFIVGSSFATGGCATVLNGTNVNYATETRPEGATARFTGGQECITPCELEMKRKNDQRVDLSYPGYKPTYVLIQSKLGGSSFGNILLGGGIGAVVDGANGASNRLYPRPLIVRLAKEGTTEEAVLLDEKGQVVMTVQQHNDSVRVDVAKTIGAKLAGIEE